MSGCVKVVKVVVVCVCAGVGVLRGGVGGGGKPGLNSVLKSLVRSAIFVLGLSRFGQSRTAPKSGLKRLPLSI